MTYRTVAIDSLFWMVCADSTDTPSQHFPILKSRDRLLAICFSFQNNVSRE